MAKLKNFADVFFHDFVEYFTPLWKIVSNRWLLLGLAVLLVVIAVFNRESIRASITENAGQYCGTLGMAPEWLVAEDEIEQVTSCFADAYGACRAATMDFMRTWTDGDSRTTLLVEPGLGPVACELAVRIKVVGNAGCDIGRPGPCTILLPCRSLLRHDLQLTLVDCGGRGDLQTPVPPPESQTNVTAYLSRWWYSVYRDILPLWDK